MARSTVAVLVTEGVPVFELAVPCEVFGVDRRDLTPDWYRLMLCAATPEPVRSTAGLLIDRPRGLAALARADTVIVPACAPAVQAAPPEPLLAALRRAHARGARIASICTGAFVLAAAGLLDGRRATTHWMNSADLARRYPAVKVDRDVLYVDEGDVLTSAGTAAGIDLCLHLVRADFGTSVANAVARRMVVPPQRDGGQAQYVDLPVPPPADDGLGPVLDWARARLDQPLTVADLAAQAHTSPRTLARRFHATTGTTPLQWLLGERLRRAQQLLESSDEPVERIAEIAGFGSPANLRQHFTRATSVSPQAYRRTFRSRTTS